MNYQHIIDFIRSLYPNRELIPLHEPHFAGNEKQYLLDCIDSTFVSSVGKYVDKFEEMIRDYTGSKYAIATVNGTAALHIALKLVGVESGDLVITQPLTFIATCNAISYCGAEPVFVDIDRNTLGLSAVALETWLSENVVVAEEQGVMKCFYLPQMGTNERSQILTDNCGRVGEQVEKHDVKPQDNTDRDVVFPQIGHNSTLSFVPICDLSFVNIYGLKRISACVPMHTFGHACQIDRLVEVCNRYHIPVVEDSAESIGSYYKGQHTGTFGKLGILSFNGNKTITTGGGGMIITNDAELGKLAKHITTTAKIPHQWKFEHDMIGYNYRLPNINAALGCAQMEQLPEILINKRKTAKAYHEFFENIDEIDFVFEPQDSISNYWLNAILVKNKLERDALLSFSNHDRIQTRPVWISMHMLPMFDSCLQSTLKITDNISERLVNLPSSYRR